MVFISGSLNVNKNIIHITDNGNVISNIHTDHLGTPRAVSDATGKLVWNWHSDPFGQAAANDDPDGDGSAFTLNLRFPGQYYDAEIALHYNYFRDYDPSTGRYVQSDPIGLGGFNSTEQNDNNDKKGRITVEFFLQDDKKKLSFGNIKPSELKPISMSITKITKVKPTNLEAKIKK